MCRIFFLGVLETIFAILLHMGAEDTASFDFALVSTYVPIFFAIFKAWILCISAHFLILLGVKNLVILCWLCWLVYVDLSRLYSTGFDKTLGHLMIIAIAIYIQLRMNEEASTGENNFMLWVCEVFWSVSNSFQIGCCLLKISITFPQFFIACSNFAMLCMHVQLHVAYTKLVFICLRVTTFILVVAALHFVTPWLKLAEKMPFNRNIKFLSMHFLFVHIFCVLGSLLVLFTLFIYVVYNVSTFSHVKQLDSPLKHSESVHANKQEDVLLLNAAKRANGFV